MVETNTAVVQPLANDTDFQPTQYWDPTTPPDEVEVAYVNWNGVRTYYLLASPDEGKIAYSWRIDGDSGTYPEDPEPTEKPLTLGELFTLLEDNCLAASSLEESWDMVAKARLDDEESDPEDSGYSFGSDFYPGLSDLYEKSYSDSLYQKSHDTKPVAWKLTDG